jgi:(p)ppGpp synthase/HD superfamily hydrolase
MDGPRLIENGLELWRPVNIPASPPLVNAFAVAQEAHRGQRRKDGRPYIEHPTQVAQLLADAGAREELLVAAVLHDAVEDSDLTVDELRDDFGGRVASLVETLTDDPDIDTWQERKDELRSRVAAAGPDAAAIYTADKITNLREVVKLYAFTGEDVADLEKAPSLNLRIAAWDADLKMATELGVHAGLRRYFAIELDALERARVLGS